MATPQLTDVAGIGEVAAANLTAAGIRTVGQLAAAGLERLESVPGFGPAKAQSAKAAARSLLDGPATSSPTTKRPAKKRPASKRPPAPPVSSEDDPPATENAKDAQKDKQKKKSKKHKGKKDKAKKKSKKHKGKKDKAKKKSKKRT